MSAAIVTISDSRSSGAAVDKGGPAVEAALQQSGITIGERRLIPDEAATIAATVRELSGTCSLIVTTGGTGVARRDVTPDALRPLFDRELPGFGEIMRTGTFEKTPLAIISRGGAGIVGRSLVVMLPGNPRAVNDCLALLGPAIRHVLKILADEGGNCEQESRPVR